MQLTFLLGNGFDKAIGLKTGYDDFYCWYLKQPSETADIEHLKKSIESYLLKKDGTWSDFEVAMGQFTAEFSDADRFMNCFGSAKTSLIQYLSEIYQNKISDNTDFLKSATYTLIELSQKADKDLSDEDKAKFTISKEDRMTFNCISFNYTPVFRDGWNEMLNNVSGISNRDEWYQNYELGNIINVHGLLNDNPILGVDTIEQIANVPFRTNDKIVQMMVKSEADKYIGAGWRKSAKNIIQMSDKIYVYGMSIGTTDEFWWKTLAEWFESDEKHELALYCHPDANQEEMHKKIETFLDGISKHFSQKDNRAKIAIDSINKSMTVKFVRMNVNAEIQTHSIAHLSVVKTQQHDEGKETHP